jgi:hypothetical protein
MTSSEGGDNNAVLSLRNFLTNGLGSRIITMMSSDLDLSVSQPVLSLSVTLINMFLFSF